VGEVAVGDMVELNERFRNKSHISAWRQVNQRGFSGNMPADSSEFESWRDNLNNTAGYVIEIRELGKSYGLWAYVHFMCFEEPFWLSLKHLKKCK